MRFVNVYAPSVRARRVGFFEGLAPLLITNRVVVFGGDLNVVVGAGGEGEVGKLCGDFGLRDVYVATGGGGVGYTWGNTRGARSRLDYFFVSKKVALSGYSAEPVVFSDHCMVGVTLALEGWARGRPRWRFRDSLMGDPVFCLQFRAAYDGWRGTRGLYADWGGWWEAVVGKIGAFCRRWVRDGNRRERERVAEGARELQSMWGKVYGGGVVEEEHMRRLEELKASTRNYYVAQAKRVEVVAGVERREENERPSKYFFQRAKARERRVEMESVKAGEVLVNSTGEILQAVATWYDDLFSVRVEDRAAADALLEGLQGVLTEGGREDLEAPLTLEELTVALGTMRNGKSPGADGLTAEFFKGFWDMVGVDVWEVLRESWERGMFPDGLRRGLITLLYKGGDPAAIGNWRPITLLSVVYKVWAKAMVLRLRGVMGDVIHPDQTCGVRGRSGAMTLALVRDTLSWVAQRGLPLAVLNLDQEKAFDRVSHHFLFRVMVKMGFGPNFMRWLGLAYRDVYSQVMVRGEMSRAVWQKGGVRQGCPLSPLLYIMVLEPLLAAIRADVEVVGVHLPGGGGEAVKLTAFADDMSLFLVSRKGFERVEGILEGYGKASGAKVNKAKSSVLFLGRWVEKERVAGEYKVADEGLKILGVWFGVENVEGFNWEKRLGKVMGKVSAWRGRGLSLSGRVSAVKADILPVVNYLAYVFPLPFWVGRRLERVLFSFIWGGRTEMVARGVMFKEVGKGGRGVPSVVQKVMALCVAFQCRLALEKVAHKAVFFARFWLRPLLRGVQRMGNMQPWSGGGGFWTCKYRYAVLLKEDLNQPGGVVHLPSTFNFGPDRGLISYPGQPLECRRCGGFGHFRRDCRDRLCRFCHSDEHESAECKAPKKCSMCGEAGHLFRMCPRVPFSYANVAAGRLLGREGEAGERGDEEARLADRVPCGQDGGVHKEARLADRVPCGQDGAPDPPLQERSGAAVSVEARPLEGGSGSAEVKATGEVPGEATAARAGEEREAADPGAPRDLSGELGLSPCAQRVMEKPPAVKDMPRLGSSVWSDDDPAAEEEMLKADGVGSVEMRAMDAIDSVARSAEGDILEDWQAERQKEEGEVVEEARKGLEEARAGAAAAEAAAADGEVQGESTPGGDSEVEEDDGELQGESGSVELFSSSDSMEASAEQEGEPSASSASPLCSEDAEGLQRRVRPMATVHSVGHPAAGDGPLAEAAAGGRQVVRPTAVGRSRGRDRGRAASPRTMSRSRSRDDRLRGRGEHGVSETVGKGDRREGREGKGGGGSL